MSVVMFLCGLGHLPTVAEKAVQKVRPEVALVNYTGAECFCGQGCKPYTCSANRRHWFEGPNQGNPSDRSMVKDVAEAVAPWIEIQDNLARRALPRRKA